MYDCYLYSLAATRDMVLVIKSLLVSSHMFRCGVSVYSIWWTVFLALMQSDCGWSIALDGIEWLVSHIGGVRLSVRRRNRYDTE